MISISPQTTSKIALGSSQQIGKMIKSHLIEKFNKFRWKRLSSIQMVIGGMTQYLTKAQGMPPEIEKKLSKRIRTYI